MSPALALAALAVSSAPLAVDSTGQDSRLLDSDQFAVFCVIGALIVALLAVVAVSGWRRR